MKPWRRDSGAGHENLEGKLLWRNSDSAIRGRILSTRFDTRVGYKTYAFIITVHNKGNFHTRTVLTEQTVRFPLMSANMASSARSRDTAHATRHTLQATRYTAHATRHMPHATRYCSWYRGHKYYTSYLFATARIPRLEAYLYTFNDENISLQARGVGSTVWYRWTPGATPFSSTAVRSWTQVSSPRSLVQTGTQMTSLRSLVQTGTHSGKQACMCTVTLLRSSRSWQHRQACIQV
jgi:hypothetical protein